MNPGSTLPSPGCYACYLCLGAEGHLKRWALPFLLLFLLLFWEEEGFFPLSSFSSLFLFSSPLSHPFPSKTSHLSSICMAMFVCHPSWGHTARVPLTQLYTTKRCRWHASETSNTNLLRRQTPTSLYPINKQYYK